ncbi:hypothetical protein K0651_08285 [Ornithinimicrobium sp. Arc0846-15]|nr:hypothetical protein [Ornithinimicrobium laminariae]
MQSKLLVAAIGAVSLVLSVLVVVGVSSQQWVLVAVAAVLLVNGTLLVALDAWRRVRMTRRIVRKELAKELARQLSESAPGMDDEGLARANTPHLIEQADLIGSMRVLQAQYVGRMDRMQASIDDAVRRLEATGDASTSSDQQAR